MAIRRGGILLLTMAAVVAILSLPCWAEQKEKEQEDIWREDEPRGPGPRRFELTDEEIDRIMKSLKETDPAKAKELEQLRKQEPEKFQEELRRYGREEFTKIIRERIEASRHKRQAEFLEWFAKNYPREAESLAKLKDKSPNLYIEKFDLVRQKYWHIFEEERRNPELAKVLKEDLELKEKRDELVIRIKAAKTEKEKTKLTARLEEVVSSRFDLIIRRKQIEYERLLRWVEELRNRVKERRDQILKAKDEKFKADNVKKHVQDLLEDNPEFPWE